MNTVKLHTFHFPLDFLITFRCHIVQSCVINDSMVEKWISTCPFLEGLQPRLGVHSNVLYVKYSCFKCKSVNKRNLDKNK